RPARLAAAHTPWGATARLVPAARVAVAHEPLLRGAPGQERVSLLRLRCVGQRPRPVRRGDRRAALPSRAGTMRAAGTRGPLAAARYARATGGHEHERSVNELTPARARSCRPNGGTPGRARRGAARDRASREPPTLGRP